MTKIKQAKTKIIQGDEITVEQTRCFEVGVHEADEMLRKVAHGGDEEELRKELIKKSTW